MKKRMLGQTGLMVSPIGLGTVKIGRNESVKYPESFSIPDDKAVKRLFTTAMELGINVIDTAPAYGHSEQRLGELLPGKREDWHIVTKVGEEFIDGISHFNFTKEHIEFSIKRSLQRLRTDYLDTVLVHSDGKDIHNIEQHGVLASLAELKQQGHIRAFGMSTKTLEGGLLAVDQSDVVMVTCNLVQREEILVIQRAHELNKGVFIKKALASGHACLAKGGDPVQESLTFIFSNPGISSVILGTINPEHLAQNIALFNQLDV